MQIVMQFCHLHELYYICGIQRLCTLFSKTPKPRILFKNLKFLIYVFHLFPFCRLFKLYFFSISTVIRKTKIFKKIVEPIYSRISSGFIYKSFIYQKTGSTEKQRKTYINSTNMQFVHKFLSMADTPPQVYFLIPVHRRHPDNGDTVRSYPPPRPMPLPTDVSISTSTVTWSRGPAGARHVTSRWPMIVLICAPVTLNFPTAAVVVVVVGKMTGVADAETIIPAETIHFLTSTHSLTPAATLNKNMRFGIVRIDPDFRRVIAEDDSLPRFVKKSCVMTHVYNTLPQSTYVVFLFCAFNF